MCAYGLSTAFYKCACGLSTAFLGMSSHYDSYSGLVSALAKITISHPFETMKIYMQTNRGLGWKTSVLSITRKSGALGFYSGAGPTLPMNLLYNTTLMSVFGKALSYTNEDATSILNIGLAGSVAGVVSSIVSCPLELARIRMQIQAGMGMKVYRSTLHCLTTSWKVSGIKGIYKGLGIMIAREIPANFCYFSTYATIMSTYGYTPFYLDTNHESTPSSVILVAGGMAGISNWMLIYPLDTIKSRIQTDSLTSPKYKGALDCYKQMSWKMLYRGYSACIIRAFLSNAASFLAIESIGKLRNNT